MSSVIDERVLFEVAPPVELPRAWAPSVYLRAFLGWQSARHPTTSNAAPTLLTAAVTYQFASAVLADFDLAPAILQARRCRRAIAPRWLTVPATALVWGERTPRLAQLMPHSRAYLELLPRSLVDRLLRWAPPVVLAADRDKRYQVVANVVSAVGARWHMPEREIQVRLLQGRVSRRSLEVMCADAVALLGPVYFGYRDVIAYCAKRARWGVLLSGYSRAQFFRTRGRVRGQIAG